MEEYERLNAQPIQGPMSQAMRDAMTEADKNMKEEYLPIEFFTERILELSETKTMASLRTFITIML